MVFNSFTYMVFLPIMVMGYYVLPRKIKHVWLLAGSYYFYMNWSAEYALLMLISTVITYLSGVMIGKANQREDKKKKKSLRKWAVALSFVLNLAILFFFKYFDFFNQSLGKFFEYINLPYNVQSFNFLLPVGISFYTFQALSYTMDVYRNKIEPQKNFITYALFVSFFPQLVAGPIEKSRNLLPQLKKIKKFNYTNFKTGAILILWGFIKKVVIADRLAILVNQVYNNVSDYQGLSLIIATVFFAFQIYCDFSAYSDIARGSAKLMGIELMRNFDKPYFSKTISEFWRRWHISLNDWFRENLYIPLGGNRKGKVRQKINVMIVFLVSGLWHGAGWTYIVWGSLNGLYNILGSLTLPITKRIDNHITSKTSQSLKVLLQIAFTFIIVTFAWIFFRANTIQDALYIVSNMFTFDLANFFSEGYLAMGLNKVNLAVAIISILGLLAVEVMSSNINLIKGVFKTHVVLRWGIYIILIAIVIIYGIYGPAYDATQFIYFQF